MFYTKINLMDIEQLGYHNIIHTVSNAYDFNGISTSLFLT